MYNQAESMEQYMSIIQRFVLRFGNSERETMPVFARCFLVHLSLFSFVFCFDQQITFCGLICHNINIVQNRARPLLFRYHSFLECPICVTVHL
jgi:hypothetical protein